MSLEAKVCPPLWWAAAAPSGQVLPWSVVLVAADILLNKLRQQLIGLMATLWWLKEGGLPWGWGAAPVSIARYHSKPGLPQRPPRAVWPLKDILS